MLGLERWHSCRLGCRVPSVVYIAALPALAWRKRAFSPSFASVCGSGFWRGAGGSVFRGMYHAGAASSVVKPVCLVRCFFLHVSIPDLDACRMRCSSTESAGAVGCLLRHALRLPFFFCGLLDAVRWNAAPWCARICPGLQPRCARVLALQSCGKQPGGLGFGAAAGGPHRCDGFSAITCLVDAIAE